MESVQHLPWELIMTILMFLPIKALVRLMCVSKEWYSFIASREFINYHFEASLRGGNKFLLSGPNFVCDNPPKPFKLLSYTNPLDISFMKTVPSKIESDCFQIVSSCAGLVCATDSDRCGSIIHLWNPFIRKSLKITSSSIDLEKFTFDDFTLLVLGFGFISETNEHKIVRIVYVEEPNDDEEEDFFHGDMILADNSNLAVTGPYFLDASTSVASQNVVHVEVFSLRTKTWRQIESLDFPWYMCDSFSRAFSNNCVHWLALLEEDNIESPVILSFDLLNEVFRDIRLPEQYNLLAFKIYEVTVYKNKLSLLTAQYNYATDLQRCSLFVLLEYGNEGSWTTLFNVELNGFVKLPSIITVNDEIAYLKRNVDDGTLELHFHNFHCNETTTFGNNQIKEADNLDFWPMISSLILLDTKTDEFMEIDEIDHDEEKL